MSEQSIQRLHSVEVLPLNGSLAPSAAGWQAVTI